MSAAESLRGSPAAGLPSGSANAMPPPAEDDLLPEARSAGFRKRMHRTTKCCLSVCTRRNLIAGFVAAGITIALIFVMAAYGTGHRTSTAMSCPALQPAFQRIATSVSASSSTGDEVPAADGQDKHLPVAPISQKPLAPRVRTVPLEVSSHPPANVSVYDTLAGLI